MPVPPAVSATGRENGAAAAEGVEVSAGQAGHACKGPWPPIPQITATMRRYLTQIGCVLRPGSVGGADLALRAFAGFLAETAPEVTSTAQVTRRHLP